jgi:hypothetical protein
MKSFREKYPGLTEEQLRIKHKIWEREKERERLLTEAREKKKIRDPFREDDEDGEVGVYDGGLDIDQGNIAVISDGPIVGANVTFIYPAYQGTTKYTKSRKDGSFLVPRSFGLGNIIISGGIDTITGIPYNGNFNIDSKFFHNFRAVTPLTHIMNHIWNLTPTRLPLEAVDLVIDRIFDFMGVPHTNITDIHRMFNNDHVALTIDNFQGAKEIQAINTLLEIHADLIGGLKANHPDQIAPLKMETYKEIANAMLTKINGQESRNYFNNVFKFHVTRQDKEHDNCCMHLLERASSDIKDSLKKPAQEATEHMQSVNFIVKDEWTQKALVMTSEPNLDPRKVWETIENKDYSFATDKIDLSGIICGDQDQ